MNRKVNANNLWSHIYYSIVDHLPLNWSELAFPIHNTLDHSTTSSLSLCSINQNPNLSYLFFNIRATYSQLNMAMHSLLSTGSLPSVSSSSFNTKGNCFPPLILYCNCFGVLILGLSLF